MKRFAHRLLLSLALLASYAALASESTAEFPFKDGDRVAWIGSSSTRIGTWCRTLEFLLRTRHPELKISFARCTTGGGTFATGIKNLPVWLGETRPTFVLFNYGGNDAAAAAKGLPQFKSNMQKCYDLVRDSGARVQFLPPQSADVRCAAQQPFDNRKLYSEEMLSFANANGWTIYDTHHRLEAFQLASQRDTPDFTMNRDRIHLTDCGYVAWGFYIYDLMNPPTVESIATLSADGKVLSAKGCTIIDVKSSGGVIEFTRNDAVLPLIPPEPLPVGNSLVRNSPTTPAAAAGMALKESVKDFYKIPSTLTVASSALDSLTGAASAAARALPSPTTVPASKTTVAPFKIPAAQVAYQQKYGQRLPLRELVPMEKHSRYMLKVTGLPAGAYNVTCEGKPIGTVSAEALATGVNLNSVLLDSKNPAPWNDLLKDLWVGRRLDEIGKTNWRFRIEKQP